MRKLKLLIALAICILIVPYSISQNTLKIENKVEALVNSDGDTSIAIYYEGATQILIDLYICEEIKKELLTKETIIDLLKLKDTLKDSIIIKQQQRYENCVEANINYLDVIDNKNKIINNLQSQVRKEKRNKIIAIIGGGLLTLLAILAF